MTKKQREALNKYKYAEQQEDRYLGSVFVTPGGRREYSNRVKLAYDECKKLGLNHENWL